MLFKRQDATKLQEQLASLKGNGGGYQKDEKEWQPTKDSDGNGSAVIRFLPEKTENDLAFVKLVTHGFAKNNQWYINNCSSTHGDYDNCPLCKYISENDLYEKSQVKGSPADFLYNGAGGKNGMKRGTGYYANVLIIKDTAKPENNGKVFKYRFGQKIMDKITAKIKGDPELDEAPVPVTCPFGGANFTIKIKKKSGYANYDDSMFGAPKPIENIDDEKFQQFLFDNMSDLGAIVAKDQFKSFEELNKQFLKVLGTGVVAGAGVSGSAALDEELDAFDKEMGSFDSKNAGATESGGVSSLSVGGDALADDGDDDIPFNTGSSGDESLDDLLNGV